MSLAVPTKIDDDGSVEAALEYLLVEGVSGVEVEVGAATEVSDQGKSEAVEASPTKKSGVVGEFMDCSVHPGDDFYRFANGRWLDTAKIPEWADETGSSYEADWAIRDVILEIVKSNPDSIAHKFFMSARNAERRAQRGITPLMGDLYKICLASSLAEFTEIMGSLAVKGVTGLFALAAEQNLSNSSRVIATIYPSAFTLPDGLHYYHKSYAAKRRKYKKQMKELLGMFGFDNIDDMSRRIFAIESSIARFSQETVDAMDLIKVNNLYTIDEFREVLGEVPLDAWARGAGVDIEIFKESVITDPQLLSRLVGKIAEFDSKPEVAKNWKAWLCWMVITNSGRALSVEINDKIFALTNVNTVRPELDLRIADFIADYMGDSVAQEYVAMYADPEVSALAESIYKAVSGALGRRIEANSWLSEKSKSAALLKLSQLRMELGAPERYRDLSGLEFGSEYYENYIAVTSYYNLSDWSMVGPFVPGRWDFGPHTVNACYSTPDNSICVPTAFLMSPWLSPELDMASNFAVFGASIVGHEISHGFDDQGSRFDGFGNISQWWDERDFEEFTRRGEKIVEHYSQLSPWQSDGECIDGELALGENLADISGVRVALDAFKLWLAENNGGVVLDGFTPMQRFFIAYAQNSRELCRAEGVDDFYFGSTHAPDEFRVNQVFRYVDEFYEAFNITPEHKLWMDPAERVLIW